jgi:hypothetical protein
MINQQSNQTYASQISAPQRGGSTPLPPAQSPTEFAARLAVGLAEINGRLENLRYRIFQDETKPSSPPPDPDLQVPLQPTLEKAHWEMNEAIRQLNEIQTRL